MTLSATGRVSGNTDAIDVVEAAYDLTSGMSETEWITRVLSALRPTLDQGLGVCAFVVDATRPFEPIAGLGIPDGWDRAMRALMFSSAREALSRPVPAASTASATVGRAAFNSNEAMRREWNPRGIHDGIGLNAADGEGGLLTFVAPMREIGSLAPRTAMRYARLCGHIASAWRLRRSLGAEDASTDAIIDPSGEVVHAEGDARSRSAIEKLRSAALAIDRARGRLRREDNDDALALWRVLVDGEWSLVDRFDSDGRRFLVARRNPPNLRDPRSLTSRQRQVVALSALGHSLKLIAYELGISSGAAAKTRSQAMRKLGVGTLSELTQLVLRVRGAERSDLLDSTEDEREVPTRPHGPTA